MKNIQKFITNYSSELLLVLFLIIPLSNHLHLTLANLFFLASFILFWQIFNQTNKKSFKVVIFIGLLLFFAIYYLISRSNISDLYIFLFTLALTINIFILIKKFPLKPAIKNDLHHILTFNLGLIICLSIILSFSANIIDRQKNQSIKQGVEEINQQLPLIQAQAMEKTKIIAKDQNINQLLVENKLDQLSRYCQNIMVAKGMTYLVITDRMGNVLVRASQPKVIGDNYFSQIPTAKTVFESDKFESIENIAGSGIFLIAGRPIKSSDNQYLGAIFAGQVFNDTLADNLASKEESVAFLQNNQIIGYSSKNLGINKIFHFTNLAQLVGRHSTAPVGFSYEDRLYLLDQTNIFNSKDESIGTIVLVKKDADKKMMQILAISMFTIINIFIYGLIMIRKIKKTRLSSKIFNIFDRKKIAKTRQIVVKTIAIFLIGQILAIVSLGSLKSTAEPLEVKTNQNIYHPTQSAISSNTVKNYYHMGEQIDYKISLNTSGKDIKTVYFKLHFSNSIVTIAEITPNQSICMPNDLPTKIIDGTISIICNINKGIELKPSQKLATITFKPIMYGIANVQIDPIESHLVTSTDQKLLPAPQKNKDNYIILP